MKNMKILTTTVLCLLLSFFMGTTAMAESITSPDGQLKLDFSVNTQGEPVYELFYKGKEVIKPSKLGLELKNDPGLMGGFACIDAKLPLSTKRGNRCGERLNPFVITIMKWLSH